MILLKCDHLGSTAITANANGAKVAEMRYLPWGEQRYASGTTPTTFRYTGQRQQAEIGLYYYGARWYDPALGRFAQADTIVPGGVQGLDRYAYVNNNPIRYTDPSGHFTEDEMCEYYGYCGPGAQDRAKAELGALFDVMWGTAITWGDIAFIEMANGEISTIMFLIFTDGMQACNYVGGFWDVDNGVKFDNDVSSSVNALGHHKNDDGTSTWAGTIASADALNWLSEKGTSLPNITVDDLLNNTDNYSLVTYVDLGGLWWSDVGVGVVGWFTPAWPLALLADMAAVGGWASDGFGWSILQGPVDATYPMAVWTYDHPLAAYHGGPWILSFIAPIGYQNR